MGSGKVPAMATSAMPKAGKAEPGRRPWRAPASQNATTVDGSTGSAPLSAIRSRDRSRPDCRRSALVASAYAKFGPAVAVAR